MDDGALPGQALDVALRRTRGALGPRQKAHVPVQPRVLSSVKRCLRSWVAAMASSAKAIHAGDSTRPN